MKTILFLVSFVLAAHAGAGEYTSLVNKGKYVCKQTTNGACAQNQITGQCGLEWDDEEGGMFQCQKWTGEIVVKPINKSKYKCKQTTNGACAQNQITGQCGPEWDSEDGGMFQCKKWTGEAPAKQIDKSKYTCKKTTNGYCAQNLVTGQCGHEWKDKDGDALFQCKKWINN